MKKMEMERETEREKAARRRRMKEQLAVGILCVVGVVVVLAMLVSVVSLFVLSWKTMLIISVVGGVWGAINWALDTLE